MKKEILYYESLLVNGFAAAVPTMPCWCLHRVQNAPGYPFVLVQVRRAWWLFGKLVTLPGGEPVSTWLDPECWRVPHRFDHRLKL